MRKSAAAIMDVIPADAIPFFNKKYLFHSRYEKVKSLFKNPSEQNILMNLTSQMNEKDLTGLFKETTKQIPTAFDSKELKPEEFFLYLVT